MKSSTKIIVGASVIAATAVLEAVASMLIRSRLEYPAESDSLDELLAQSQRSDFWPSLLEGAVQMFWLPMLIGFVLMSIGAYQTAQAVEILNKTTRDKQGPQKTPRNTN